jgi:hypothetical protein
MDANTAVFVVGGLQAIPSLGCWYLQWKQWQHIKGGGVSRPREPLNFLRWGCVLATTCLTTVGVGIYLSLRGRFLPTLIAELAILIVIALIWTAFYKVHGENRLAVGTTTVIPKIATGAPPERVDNLSVELRPTTGRSDKIFLEVKNSGNSQTFHARCKNLNDPDSSANPRLISFDLSWERDGRNTLIAHNDSCNLLIATTREERLTDLQYLSVCGLSGDTPETVLETRWLIGTESSQTPYKLEITIFGDATQTHLTRQFTLGPGEHSALEMLTFPDNQIGLSKSDLRSEQTPDDPRVYLVIVEQKFGPVNADVRTAFVASNEGGTEARNIRIDFPLPSGGVTFEPVDVLTPKAKADMIPEVAGDRWPGTKYNIYTALLKTPYSAGEANYSEFTFTLTYENYNRGRRFECPMTLVFRPNHERFRRRGMLGDGGKKTAEIKHGDCRVVLL